MMVQPLPPPLDRFDMWNVRLRLAVFSAASPTRYRMVSLAHRSATPTATARDKAPTQRAGLLYRGPAVDILQPGGVGGDAGGGEAPAAVRPPPGKHSVAEPMLAGCPAHAAAAKMPRPIPQPTETCFPPSAAGSVYALGVLDVPSLPEGRPMLLLGDTGEGEGTGLGGGEGRRGGGRARHGDPVNEPLHARLRTNPCSSQLRTVCDPGLVAWPLEGHTVFCPFKRVFCPIPHISPAPPLSRSVPALGAAATARDPSAGSRHRRQHRLFAAANGLLGAAPRAALGERQPRPGVAPLQCRRGVPFERQTYRALSRCMDAALLCNALVFMGLVC